MPSRSLLSVQEKLERRWRYVQEAEWDAIALPMAAYLRFVHLESPLRVAVIRLADDWPNIPQWYDDAIREHGAGDKYHPTQSHADSEAAARGLEVFRRAQAYDGKLVEFANELTRLISERILVGCEKGRANFEWRCNFVLQTYLRPLHEYLLDALDANVETLAAIRWFQQWAQWFGASRFAWERRLEDDAVKDGKKKIHEYEKRFQPVLFEKLFEYGLRLDIEINREPSTASGEPDFMVTQQTAAGPRAIPVEAKIVDSRCDASTRFGFRQLRRYMDERHADAGYLVLFDTTPHGHQIDLADAPDGVPFIPLAGQRRVYVVFVPTCQQLSASLDRKAAPARPGLTRAHFDEHAD